MYICYVNKYIYIMCILYIHILYTLYIHYVYIYIMYIYIYIMCTYIYVYTIVYNVYIYSMYIYICTQYIMYIHTYIYIHPYMRACILVNYILRYVQTTYIYIWSRPPSLHPPPWVGSPGSSPNSLLFASYWQHF